MVMTEIVSKVFPTAKGVPFFGVLREFRRNPIKFMIEIRKTVKRKIGIKNNHESQFKSGKEEFLK